MGRAVGTTRCPSLTNPERGDRVVLGEAVCRWLLSAIICSYQLVCIAGGAMVPTTFNGIVLLLILLVPGFFYVLRRERHTPSRKFSGFRETLRVIVASAFAYGLLAALSLVVALLVPSVQNLAVALVVDPFAYQASHAVQFAFLVVGGVALATAVSAFAGGTIAIRLAGWLVSRNEKARRWFEAWRAEHAPISSAWWTVFELEPLAAKILSVRLSDGTVLTGQLYSYSQDADDHADRDVVLQAPLFIQNPDSDEVHELPGASVIISAREIRFLTVRYESAPDDS